MKYKEAVDKVGSLPIQPEVDNGSGPDEDAVQAHGTNMGSQAMSDLIMVSSSLWIVDTGNGDNKLGGASNRVLDQQE